MTVDSQKGVVTTTVTSILHTQGPHLDPLEEEDEEDLLREVEERYGEEEDTTAPDSNISNNNNDAPLKKKRTSILFQNVKNLMTKAPPKDVEMTDASTITATRSEEEEQDQLPLSGKSPMRARRTIISSMFRSSNGEESSPGISSELPYQQKHPELDKEDGQKKKKEKVTLSPVKKFKRFVLPKAEAPSKARERKVRKKALNEILGHVEGAIGDANHSTNTTSPITTNEETLQSLAASTGKDKSSGGKTLSKFKKKASNLFHSKGKDDAHMKNDVTISENSFSSSDQISQKSPISNLLPSGMVDDNNATDETQKLPLQSSGEDNGKDASMPKSLAVLNFKNKDNLLSPSAQSQRSNDDSTKELSETGEDSKASSVEGLEDTITGRRLMRRQRNAVSPTRGVMENAEIQETPRRGRITRRQSRNLEGMTATGQPLRPERRQVQRSVSSTNSNGISSEAKVGHTSDKKLQPRDRVRPVRRKNSKSAELSNSARSEEKESEGQGRRRRIRRSNSSSGQLESGDTIQAPQRRRVRRSNSKSKGVDTTDVSSRSKSPTRVRVRRSNSTDGQRQQKTAEDSTRLDDLSPTRTSPRRRVRRLKSRSKKKGENSISDIQRISDIVAEDPLGTRRRIKRSNSKANKVDITSPTEEQECVRRSQSPVKHSRELQNTKSSKIMEKKQSNRRRRHRSGSPGRSHPVSPKNEKDSHQRRHRSGSPNRSHPGSPTRHKERKERHRRKSPIKVSTSRKDGVWKTKGRMGESSSSKSSLQSDTSIQSSNGDVSELSKDRETKIRESSESLTITQTNTKSLELVPDEGYDDKKLSDLAYNGETEGCTLPGHDSRSLSPERDLQQKPLSSDPDGSSPIRSPSLLNHRKSFVPKSRNEEDATLTKQQTQYERGHSSLRIDRDFTSLLLTRQKRQHNHHYHPDDRSVASVGT